MRQLVLALMAGAAVLAGCGGSAAAPSTPASASAAASAPAKPAASGSAAAKPSASGATSATYGDPNGSPIKIAYASPAVASWPFYGAVAGGFYEQQHLKVTMIQAAPNVTITALSKGEIDFTNSPGNAIEGATRGLPMKVVLSAWQRSPWTISGKQELKSVKDLKGKIVGTNQAGSTPYLYLQAGLKREGLAMSDVQVVSSPGTQDTFALLLAGRLDAAVLSPPFDANAETKGFHEVAFIGDALQEPYIGLGTSATFLSQHRPELVRLLRALMDSNQWLKDHPDQAADLIVKNLGVTPDIAKRSTQKMLPLLSSTGEMPLSAVEEAIGIQEEITKTKSAVKPEDLVDWGPLHEALGKA